MKLEEADDFATSIAIDMGYMGQSHSLDFSAGLLHYAEKCGLTDEDQQVIADCYEADKERLEKLTLLARDED
jgi:hypothetical protein